MRIRIIRRHCIIIAHTARGLGQVDRFISFHFKKLASFLASFPWQ